MGKQTLLGASEFAATLNGDDPTAILRVLKQFTKTVQRERRLALSSTDGNGDGSNSDDDSSSSDEEGDDEVEAEQRPTKKFKKDEQWKEDSASYHVPFVGTSVAKSDVADVVRGQWPTGLLEAYLVKSPLAIELTSDDLDAPDGQIHKSLARRKKVRMSRAIHKAYLRALAELVTAAIPLNELRDSESLSIDGGGDVVMVDELSSRSASSNDKFLPLLLKKRMAGIFKLLNEETGRGRGKYGVFGGCGDLVEPTLKLLQNIALVSVTHARLVSQNLDEALNDGVLRCILKPLPQRKEKENSTITSDDAKAPRKGSRVEAINLVTTLIKTRDSAVNTYICTGGSKERKVKPGILFIAFREGLILRRQGIVSLESDDDYFDAIADLMYHFRLLILNQSRSINQKLLLNLLRKEPMQNLCQLLSHAPPLTDDNTVSSVIGANDSYPELESLPNAAVEARRLLFPLLSDPSKSPFLSSRNMLHSSEAEQLIRTLVNLRQIPNAGITMQHFLVDCVQRTPTLLPGFFKLLAFPDHKNIFEFISWSNLVSSLMRQGPSPLECLSHIQDHTKADLMDDIIVAIFPIKFKRQTLAKSLQSGNPLVVLECLKLITASLERFRILKEEGLKEKEWSNDFIDKLSNTFSQCLPDIQILLTVRTRFDAFTTNKTNALINHGLNRVLDSFALILPSLIKEAKFDWMKLIPGKASQFFGGLPLIQRSVLGTLNLVIGLCESSSSSVINACKNVLEIMLTTKSEVVHGRCRQIVSRLLLQILQSRWADNDSVSSIEHECECWIDGLTLDSLPDFCKLLHGVSDNALGIIAGSGDAWTHCRDLGPIEFSLLLVASLNSPNLSQPFSLLVGQVCTKSLLFHRSPLMLATLIHFLTENSEVVNVVKSETNTNLVNYASSLRTFAPESQAMQIKLLGKILKSYLSAEDIFVIAFNYFTEDVSMDVDNLMQSLQSKDRLLSFVRFLIHAQIIFSKSDPASNRCWKLLCRTIPNILLQLDSNDRKSQVLEDICLSRGRDKVFELIVMSCPVTLELSFSHSRMKEITEGLASVKSNGCGRALLSKQQRVSLLQFLLLGDVIPMNSVAKAQLALLGNLKSNIGNLSEMPIDVIFSFIKNTGSRLESDIDYEPAVLSNLFNTWWILSDEAKVSSSPSFHEVRAYFSSLLTAVLQKANAQSSMLIAVVNGREGNSLIEQCLVGVTKRPASQELKFLKLVLESNFFSLAPDVLNKFRHSTPNLRMAWENGFLDVLLLSIVQNADSLAVKEEDAQEFFRLILKHTEFSISKVARGEQGLSDIESSLRLIHALLKSPATSSMVEISAELFKDLSVIIETQGFKKDPAAKSLLELAVLLVVQNDFKFCEPNAVEIARKYMASTLLLHFFESLPSTFKGQEYKEAFEILTWLLTLISEAQDYDLKVWRNAKPLLVQKVFRTVLKYGIGVSERNPAISSIAIKFLRELVTGLSDPTSPLSILKAQLLVISLTDVFNMLTSHSKFPVVLGSDDQDAELVKLELVKLMFCCVARSDKGIVIGPEVWTTLFSAFNAGLGELDTSIRKLFYACCDLLEKSNDVHIPFLDEFRWKGFLGDGPQGSSRWDWLVEAIDPNRIRATISHFPVYDTVKVDLGMADNDPSNSDEGDSSGEESDDDNASEDEDSIGSDSTETQINPRNGLFPGAEWSHHGQDIRYSPAFLLPFILGALESTMPSPDKKNTTDFTKDPSLQNQTEDDSSGLNYEVFVLIAKRLCDKEALSLCLASLSSKCDTTRCYAVSIMGMLLRASNSEEARALSSWRGRPQLAMLLNSVQRAFVIKKGTRISSGSSLQVPILPPLVSSFLARASLSISRPDDALFVPLNRYFLKNENNHGAFSDMNRLPGFISLFCSASDDQSQARKERMWALQLVRDGYLDASCYRMLTSCHAPELILSSFENVRLSQVSDEMKDTEFTLMLDVLVKLVKFGSNQVVSHLLSRLGLLSWMRSWCISWPLSQSFPGIKSKISFCELVNCAVMKAGKNERLKTDTFIHEVCGLEQPIILLGLESNSSDENFPLLLSTICQALDSLRKVILDLRANNLVCHDVQPLGISLQMSTDFLKTLDTNLQDKAIYGLSCLPIWFDDSSTDEARNYCSVLLDHCLKTCENDEKAFNLQSSIIQRVQLVAKNFSDSISCNSDLIKKLLAIRPKFVKTEKQYEIWTQCLEVFTSNVSSSCDSEFTVSRELFLNK